MTTPHPDFIALLDSLTTISDTQKRTLMQTAQSDQVPADFEAVVQAIIDDEIAATERKRKQLDQQLADARHERDAAHAEAAPAIAKLTTEYTQLCQTELNTLQTQLSELAKEHDERVEGLVKTESEDAEVAAIRAKLQNQ